tara:strand:+ start:769 stop:1158 length:390 start_codon:yes stop_codon:yes gene_type:complete
MATLYTRKSRLTRRQESKLIEHFVVGSTARATANVVGVQANTTIIPNAKTETLLPIIREYVGPDSIVYMDTFGVYNALDVSDFHHHRVNHSKIFADKQNHINGIETFWNLAKRHMRKCNGIKPDNFTGF